MSFDRIFSQRPAILPVIHVSDKEQALRNVDLARAEHVEGVFLINHGFPAAKLLAIHGDVVDEHPDWWVGVNCLDLPPREVFKSINESVAGVWVDNAMIDESAEPQPAAQEILNVREARGLAALYFGGVAFKYQRTVDDLAQAAAKAMPYMDVVTTSGPGTGRAATPEKVKIMKQALGEHPLAIASGIAPENVADYVDYADCFLVATGISSSFHELDADRLRALVNTIREST